MAGAEARRPREIDKEDDFGMGVRFPAPARLARSRTWRSASCAVRGRRARQVRRGGPVELKRGGCAWGRARLTPARPLGVAGCAAAAAAGRARTRDAAANNSLSTRVREERLVRWRESALVPYTSRPAVCEGGLPGTGPPPPVGARRPRGM
jgi:hypothetical protein